MRNDQTKLRRSHEAPLHVKKRPILFNGPMVRAILEGRKTQTRRIVRKPERLQGLMNEGEEGDWCPYGKPGDRLWVRETFSQNEHGELAFRADGQEFEDGDGWHWEPKWKPSIFMPRWASRLTLEINTVRVERLREITIADAVAEGCGPKEDRPTEKFHALWDSINAKPGKAWASWAQNPWVWVIQFHRTDD